MAWTSFHFLEGNQHPKHEPGVTIAITVGKKCMHHITAHRKFGNTVPPNGPQVTYHWNQIPEMNIVWYDHPQGKSTWSISSGGSLSLIADLQFCCEEVFGGGTSGPFEKFLPLCCFLCLAILNEIVKQFANSTPTIRPWRYTWLVAFPQFQLFPRLCNIMSFLPDLLLHANQCSCVLTRFSNPAVRYAYQHPPNSSSGLGSLIQ